MAAGAGATSCGATCNGQQLGLGSIMPATAKPAAAPVQPRRHDATILEAFSWWLSQERKGRTWKAVAEAFGIPKDTATKWVWKFNKTLSEHTSPAVEAKLRQYRREHDVVQSEMLTVIADIVEAVKTNSGMLRAMAKSGNPVDPDLISKTASSAKSVYQLMEAVTGADLAKRVAAKAISGSGSGSSSSGSLPDFAGWAAGDPDLFLDAESETLGESQQAFSPGSNPENGSGEAGSSVE